MNGLRARVIDELGGRSACQKRRIVAVMYLSRARVFFAQPRRQALAVLARQQVAVFKRRRLRPPTQSRQRARIQQNLVDCRVNQFQQRIKPGLVWPRDEKRTRGPEVDPGGDIFCNNKILEEMAEAWKNEMSLG
jgi:hypothetical protein